MKLLCELDYPGNIRALRNLIYELTSFLNDNEPISTNLIQFALDRLRCRGSNSVALKNDDQLKSPNAGNVASAHLGENMSPGAQYSFLHSIAKEGDIILPLELCVLRKGESFKQWTARAKRCSIEAAHQATGGMQSAAERLGLSWHSLRAHLKRARRNQNQRLFDWEREPD